MGPTERRFRVAASIAVLLALTATTGAAAPVGSGDAGVAPSSVSASPEAFAERLAAGEHATDGRGPGSWHNALELIALAVTCAIAAALYSAATAKRTDTPVPVRVRRR